MSDLDRFELDMITAWLAGSRAVLQRQWTQYLEATESGSNPRVCQPLARKVRIALSVTRVLETEKERALENVRAKS